MSMAMAYGMKKRAKKCHGGEMAAGGGVEPSGYYETEDRKESSEQSKDDMETKRYMQSQANKPKHQGVHEAFTKGTSVANQAGGATEKYLHKQKHSELQQMNKKKDMGMGYPKHFARGGMMTGSGYQSDCVDGCEDPAHIHEEASGFVDHMGDDKKHNGMAMHEDDMDFNQHGDMDEGAGGMDEMSPIVKRIMMGRMKGFSQGGKVANSDMPEADFMPNEFDDLHLRDDLEQHDTGANSGDEMGDEQEDHDRKDIVSRIMKSRKKKDRMPNPA